MEKKIDITQKAPAKKEKNFKNNLKKFLFYFVQWTWGLPVNLVGGIVFLICTKGLKRRYQKFGYARITYLPWKQGGLSLGLFIFMRDPREHTIVVELSFSSLNALGGDEYHTICTLRTIDGSSGCVLKDFHRHDIRWVEG